MVDLDESTELGTAAALMILYCCKVCIICRYGMLMLHCVNLVQMNKFAL